jgi:hypothetical protein
MPTEKKKEHIKRPMNAFMESINFMLYFGTLKISPSHQKHTSNITALAFALSIGMGSSSATCHVKAIPKSAKLRAQQIAGQALEVSIDYVCQLFTQRCGHTIDSLHQQR